MPMTASITNRILVGKTAGFVIGLIAFLAVPALMPGVDPLLRWGMLLWYTTLGGLIGLFGLFSRHPVLLLPMPWWLRGSLLGAWMNFVLTFFAYDVLAEAMVILFGADGALTSPFWFVAEGAVVGLIIAGIATHIGGEGPATARELPE